MFTALSKSISKLIKNNKDVIRNRGIRRILRMEGLERREVFDANFESVLTVGNDNASIGAWDNAFDSVGNSYVAGSIYGEMDFDPATDRSDRSDILVAKGSTDAFIAKFGPQNEFLWARRMGGDSVLTNPNDPLEGSRNIVVNGNGDVYASGIFNTTADFGSIQLTSAGSADAFVTKLDTNGNFIWAKSWGSTSRDFGYGITLDGNDNVISVGAKSNLASNGAWTHTGAEIRKYSSTGNLVWSKSLSGNGLNAGEVAVDHAGSIFVSGSFAGTVDFNPDPKRSNTLSGSSVVTGGAGRNAYVLKLNASGSFAAAVPLVALTNELANSSVSVANIAIDPSGAVIIGGSISGRADLDPNSRAVYRLPNVPSTGSVGFIEKLSSSLTFTWATEVAAGRIESFAVDATGIYAVGSFSKSFSFKNTTYSSAGASDVFVIKVDHSGASDWVQTFGATGEEAARAIALDASGLISILGTFLGTCDFDPDPTNTNVRTNSSRTDMYLLKLRRV